VLLSTRTFYPTMLMFALTHILPETFLSPCCSLVSSNQFASFYTVRRPFITTCLLQRLGIAQFLGAIAATAILSGLTPGPLSVSPSLASGVSISQGLFIETFGSMILVLSVLLLAIEKHTSSFLAPVGIGLTLFAVHLFAVQFTGSGVNTARAFAPCVVTGKFEGYHWIYWVGPTLGAVLIDVICESLLLAFVSNC